MASNTLQEVAPLEEMGILCSTLFLDSFLLPSLEEVRMIFEDWIKKDFSKSRFTFLMTLFKNMSDKEKYFLKISKLTCFSEYFAFDKVLSPIVCLEFFQKLVLEDYTFRREEVSFFLDVVPNTILYNNVTSSRVSATCKLFGMLANDLLSSEALHKHALDYDVLQ